MKTEGPPLIVPHSEREAEERPIFRKVLLIATGIFLVVLILSYLWIDFPIGDILKGRWESTPAEGDLVQLGGYSITFENNTLEQINALYLLEQENEFSLCLRGKKEGNNYRIVSYYIPKIYQQSFNQVIFEPCSEDTLIILHTHPYKSCLASSTDFEMFNKAKFANPEVLMVVMCEPRRFSVYGAENSEAD
ncbi:hypothetical protein HZC32_02095 [Candidatus Woesearchaeota archaeon]|nr:hypothetical protein [Candidatus Woesearchaeota archaeon]